MADDRLVKQIPATLPRALVERLTRPFSRFVQIETAAGAVLLAATLVALLRANSRWADALLAFWEIPVGLHIGPGQVVRSLKEWINDGVMTLFFAGAEHPSVVRDPDGPVGRNEQIVPDTIQVQRGRRVTVGVRD